MICQGPHYQDRCNRHLGYIWHRNSKAMFSIENYKRTLLLYRQNYGKPPRRIWPHFADAQEMQLSREGFILVRSSLFLQLSQDLEQKSLEFNPKEFTEYSVKQVSMLREKTRLRPNTMDAIIQMLLAPEQLKRPQTALTETTLAQESLYQQAEEDWIQGKQHRGRSGSLTLRSRRFLDSVTLDDVISEEMSTMEQISGRSRYFCQKKVKPESRQIQESSALDISVESDFLEPPQEQDSILLKAYHSSPSEASSKEEDQDDEICVAVGTIDDDIFNQTYDSMSFNQYFQSNKAADISRFQKTLKTLPLPKLVMKSFKREFNVCNQLAELVVDEYKRFLILTRVIKGINIIPSQLIKLLWDTHAIETRSYLNYCIVAFHEQIPIREIECTKQNMVDYLKTLDMYEWVFKSEPPRDIWVPLRERFNPSDSYNCVDLRLLCAALKKKAKIKRTLLT